MTTKTKRGPIDLTMLFVACGIGLIAQGAGLYPEVFSPEWWMFMVGLLFVLWAVGSFRAEIRGGK